VKAVASQPVPRGKGDDLVLVCPTGHSTIHSLVRVLRLNDGWCGVCGVGIPYEPAAKAGKAPKGGAVLKDVSAEA
jgi:hypothetical protein